MNENSPQLMAVNQTKKNTTTVFGINNALSVLGSERFNVLNIVIQKNCRAEKNPNLMKAIHPFGGQINYYEKRDFAEKYQKARSQGIVVTFTGEIISHELPDFSQMGSVCLLALDQVEDPQNFGQIIRTAECAGIDGILFPKHHSSPITDAVLQVSQGAFVHMPLYEVTNLRHEFDQLKKEDFWIVGLENSIDAKPWHEIDYKEKTVIVVGSEGKGIREKVLEACDFHATIPMQGKTNSLNVSAAVSAILFERLRQVQETR